MTLTSEERREVAARLRKAADSDEWLDLTIENAIFGVFGEVRRPAADTLADLIDPTCHLLPSYDGGFGCDRCYTWFPSMKGKPRFCPERGARVVTDDD